ncbi:MAG TPA: L,D-transpeptidase [Caulobacteraceae bacterium]
MPARQVTSFCAALALGGMLAACDDFKPKSNAAQGAPVASVAPAPQPATQAEIAAPAPGAAPTPTPADARAPLAAGPAASSDPRAAPIESSAFSAARSGPAQTPLLIKVEVLLDRAHFSPGVIDGRGGANLKRALAAFEQAHGLAADGNLNQADVDALTADDKAPITQDYVITPDDEKGPFIGALPSGFVAQAKLDHLGYLSPLQEMAERFHMDPALIKSLNPGADFTVTGTRIVVVRPASGGLAAPVARIEVDKTANQLRALDVGGKILAVFPATVGSTERPAPSGQWAVKSVTTNPNYVYDPSRLTFGPAEKGKLTIQPGPNNPVGTTWIALTKETYGIHGSPDPTRVGKTASHGCVRLTNWDAATLGRSVKKGVPVIFVGVEKTAA